MSVFSIEQAGEELASVHKFQTHAQLAGVKMKSFCARSAEKEPEIAGGLGLELKHSATRGEVEGGAARFDVKLEIEALGDKDPEKMLFHVDCCFELTYDLTPGYSPTEFELEAFKKGNALFHCWPYMREFVQSATQRMGLSIPPIPLLRLIPPASTEGSRERTRAAEAGGKETVKRGVVKRKKHL